MKAKPKAKSNTKTAPSRDGRKHRSLFKTVRVAKKTKRKAAG